MEEQGKRDELEALRQRLLARMRRQPADMGALMRSAEGLSRMAAAEGRLSGKRRRELAASIEAVLAQFAEILPRE